MDATKTGGPAFPVTLFEGQALGDSTANGMTLRDYFAAKAMQATIAGRPVGRDSYLLLAQRSYEMADAMLEAREVTK